MCVHVHLFGIGSIKFRKKGNNGWSGQW